MVKINFVDFEVLIVINKSFVICWVVTKYILVDSYYGYMERIFINCSIRPPINRHILRGTDCSAI